MQWFYSELLFSASFKDSKSGAQSWAGVSLGVASAERIIVVATGDQAGSPISSVTVAGISATRRVNNGHAQIWTASVPLGTTGTVVVASSSASLNGVGVYSLYGLNSEVPAHTATGTTSVSLDVNDGGFAIASFSTNLTSTPVWTGLTRDYFGSPGASTLSSASGFITPAQTVSISETLGGTAPVMAAASWGPT